MQNRYYFNTDIPKNITPEHCMFIYYFSTTYFGLSTWPSSGTNTCT